jgi:hypothetical protein
MRSLALTVILFLLTFFPKGHAQSLEKVFDGNACFVPIPSNLSLVFPSIIRGPDNEFWAYGIRDGLRSDDVFSSRDVVLYKSADGINWRFIKTVLTPGSSYFNNIFDTFPDVLQVNGLFYMVTECKGTGEAGCIGLAVSSDGLNFQRDQKPLLRQDRSAIEKVNIGTPSLFFEGGQWYLFYHSYGSSSFGGKLDVQICLAKGADLHQLRRVVNNPIIATDKFGPASGTVGRRNILKSGGYYYMVAEVSTDDKDSFSGSDWSSGIWRAPSLEGPWFRNPFNPVLPSTGSGFGMDGPTFFTDRKGAVSIYFRNPTGGTSIAKLASRVPPSSPPWIYNATSPQLQHQVGKASAGLWLTTVNDPEGYSIYGPYITSIPPRNYNSYFYLRVDNATANNDVLVRIEVYDSISKRILTSRDIARKEWLGANLTQQFSLPFTAMLNQSLEFRVLHRRRAAIGVEKIVVAQ